MVGQHLLPVSLFLLDKLARSNPGVNLELMEGSTVSNVQSVPNTPEPGSEILWLLLIGHGFCASTVAYCQEWRWL